jgi:signal transduction histidine kinase
MINTGNYRILIIEDNQGDFVLVEELLWEQIMVPDISHAVDYKTAKELLSQENIFDIILLDLSLPDKTGPVLIEDIVKAGASAAVIVLTGYEDFTFGIKSLALGASDYILKDELTSVLLFKSIVYSCERKKIVSALELSEKNSRTFAKQLNHVLEEQRAHIAREIHDEFGQQLSGLKMSLSSLKKNPGVKKETTPTIDAIIEQVDNGIQSLRRIANELRPVLLDKLGLFAAIEWLVVEFEKRTGITSQTFIDKEQPVLDKVIEINIFRICQEALTNITKHAQANKAYILVGIKNEELLIKISDDGKGIEPEILKNTMAMGMLNMKERASIIGGEIIVNSAPGKGTSVELKLKING